MKTIVKFLSCSAFIVMAITLVQGQIVLDSSLSLIDQVKTLQGPGVEFSNIVINCPGTGGSAQMGLFDATNSNVGIDHGLVMTSGSISNVPGPNNSDGATTDIYSPGDPDLDIIVDSTGWTTSNDACIIEFDLKMAGDTLMFDFAFGSEEYPEYVNSINDVFGFFISGPGISGPFSNGSKNIALLPDGVTPVSINSINDGVNSLYYNSNGTGMAGQPQYNDVTVIQYDGFTTVLTATSPVQACQLYHIKLAVADASDEILDSGVFLEGGSFISNKYSVNTAFANVYEGCKEGGITFHREDGLDSDSIVIFLGYGGTATNGVDYGVDNGNGGIDPMPESVILLPFEDSLVIDIPSINDNNIEDGETIIIYLLNEDCSGNFTAIDSFEITLYDEIVVEANDTLVCPGDTVVVKAVSPETVFFKWNPDATGDTVTSTFTIYPVESVDYVITVQDTFGCFGYDTANIEVMIVEEIPFRYEYNLLNQLEVYFFPDSVYDENSYTFLWKFNDSTGATSTQREPSYEFPSNGIYPVELHVIPFGNGEIDCNPVIVQNVILDGLELPNIITPNGDGINDYFKVRGVYGYELSIFNRWGKRVYFSEKYTNDFDANGLPDGMYYCYIAPLTTRDTYKGWFRVAR